MYCQRAMSIDIQRAMKEQFAPELKMSFAPARVYRRPFSPWVVTLRFGYPGSLRRHLAFVVGEDTGPQPDVHLARWWQGREVTNTGSAGGSRCVHWIWPPRG